MRSIVKLINFNLYTLIFLLHADVTVVSNFHSLVHALNALNVMTLIYARAASVRTRTMDMSLKK